MLAEQLSSFESDTDLCLENRKDYKVIIMNIQLS